MIQFSLEEIQILKEKAKRNHKITERLQEDVK